jgi:hypothetical protein
LPGTGGGGGEESAESATVGPARWATGARRRGVNYSRPRSNTSGALRGFSWSDERLIRRHDPAPLARRGPPPAVETTRGCDGRSSPMAMGPSACGTGLDPWRMSARIFPPRGGSAPTGFHRRTTTKKCIRIRQLAGGLLSALLGADRVSRGDGGGGQRSRLGSEGNARLPRGRSPWIAQSAAARCSERVSAKIGMARRSFTTSARPAGTRPRDHCPRQTDALGCAAWVPRRQGSPREALAGGWRAAPRRLTRPAMAA